MAPAKKKEVQTSPRPQIVRAEPSSSLIEKINVFMMVSPHRKNMAARVM